MSPLVALLVLVGLLGLALAHVAPKWPAWLASVAFGVALVLHVIELAGGPS